MPRRHFAKAIVSRQDVAFDEWMEVLRDQHEGVAPKDRLHRVAKNVLRKCDPNQYLLSHSTIVASVDVTSPRGVKTGRLLNRGVQIDVKWPDFRITPECEKFVNNNCFLPGAMILMADGTEKSIETVQMGDEVISHLGISRKVISVFDTYATHQIRTITRKGDDRALHATTNHPFFVNVGDRYGIFAAEDLRVGDMLRGLNETSFNILSIESSETAAHVYNIEVDVDHTYVANGVAVHNCDSWTRSLLLSTYRTFIGAPNYCFLPDTKILMSDGTQRSIEDVSVGDEVITHLGRARKVVHKHVRDYVGEIVQTSTGSPTPISCTPNHPFLRFDLTGNVEKARADTLQIGDILYLPNLQRGRYKLGDSARYGRLLGHCLARYVESNANTLTFDCEAGAREEIQSILDCLRAVSPHTLPSLAVSGGRILIEVRDFSLASFASRQILVDKDGINRLRMPSLSAETDESILSLIGTLASFTKQDSEVIRIESSNWELLDQLVYLSSIIGLHGTVNREVALKTGTDGARTLVPASSCTICFQGSDAAVLRPYMSRVEKLPVLDESDRASAPVTLVKITSVEKNSYEGKVFNLEVEEDHSYVAGCVAVGNCEHIQLPELSKGFIVDAIARDLGETCYVDILVATDRKHTKLVQDIVAGQIDSMSMGAISLFTICTKCGNVAADDSSLCPCIVYDGKGSKFIDEDGQERMVAELIGHVSVPNSNQFIEASWVRNPAFTGAVRRNILNPLETQTATKMEKAHVLYDVRLEIPEMAGVKKAASTKRRAQGEDEAPVQDAAPADDVAPQDSSPSQDSGEGDSEFDSVDAPTEPNVDGKDKSVDALFEKIQQQLLESIVKRLGEKLEPTSKDVANTTVPPVDLESGNDNFVHSSLQFDAGLKKFFPNEPKLQIWASRMHRVVHGGGKTQIRTARVTARDLIILSWIEDRIKGRDYPAALYKAAMRTGSMSNFPSETSYLAFCQSRLGRDLTERDRRFLLWKGRIASLSAR